MESNPIAYITFDVGGISGYVRVLMERGSGNSEIMRMDLRKFMDDEFTPLLREASLLPQTEVDCLPVNIEHLAWAGGLSLISLKVAMSSGCCNLFQLQGAAESFAYKLAKKMDKKRKFTAETMLAFQY